MNWGLGRTYLYVVFFDKQTVIGIPFSCHTVPVKVQPVFILFAEGQNGSLRWIISRCEAVWHCAVPAPSRGQYHRLPAVGWEWGLDPGPGWRQTQGGEDDPTQVLLGKVGLMARRGLKLEGSDLSAVP